MEKGLTSGRGPTGVAAAALYIASVLLGERKTQRDVADIAGVTEVTIRNRYKELTEQIEMGVTLQFAWINEVITLLITFIFFWSLL